jgi:hypothetical protein
VRVDSRHHSSRETTDTVRRLRPRRRHPSPALASEGNDASAVAGKLWRDCLDTRALKADRFTVVNLEVPGDEQAVPRGYHCVMPGCGAKVTAYLPPICTNHKVEVEMVEDLV